MARLPASQRLADLTGNPRRRFTKELKVPDGKPGCPEYLDAVAKEEWQRVSALLDEMGVLTLADETALAAYADAYSRWRDASDRLKKVGSIVVTPNKSLQTSPLHTIMRQSLADMTTFLKEFGLTPLARKKMLVDADKEHKPARGGLEDLLG